MAAILEYNTKSVHEHGVQYTSNLIIVFGNVSRLSDFTEFHPSKLKFFLYTKDMFLGLQFLRNSTYEPLVNNDRGLFFFKDGGFLGSTN